LTNPARGASRKYMERIAKTLLVLSATAGLAGCVNVAAPERPIEMIQGCALGIAEVMKHGAASTDGDRLAREAGSDLRGRVAIANAQRAYVRYRQRFADERWLSLREAGARPQRPLWASTGTKDPAYSDVLYVEQLIAPEVVNTMPEATLRAFADHGDVGEPLNADGREAEELLRRAADNGIDLPALTAELERDGVRSFCDSYRELLGCIDAKRQVSR